MYESNHVPEISRETQHGPEELEDEQVVEAALEGDAKTLAVVRGNRQMDRGSAASQAVARPLPHPRLALVFIPTRPLLPLAIWLPLLLPVRYVAVRVAPSAILSPP